MHSRVITSLLNDEHSAPKYVAVAGNWCELTESQPNWALRLASIRAIQMANAVARQGFMVQLGLIVGAGWSHLDVV